MTTRGPLDVTGAPFVKFALQTVSDRLISDGKALEGLRGLQGWSSLESTWSTMRHRYRNSLAEGNVGDGRNGLWAWGVVQEAVIDAILEGQDAVGRSENKDQLNEIKDMTDDSAAEILRQVATAREVVEHPGFAVACERWAGIQRGLRTALEVCGADAQPAIQSAIHVLQQPVVKLRNLLRLGLVADAYFTQQAKEGTGGETEA